LGSAGGDFTEYWTLTLPVQDLLMELSSQHLFPSRGAFIFGEDLVLLINTVLLNVFIKSKSSHKHVSNIDNDIKYFELLIIAHQKIAELSN